MGVNIKKETTELKGEKVIFHEESEYKAIKLKSNGKVTVQHRILADRLVNRKLAEYVKDAKLEVTKPNTKVLD